MTRAAVEDSTAGLGQTLRTERLVVGGLSFHDVSGMCMNSLAQQLPGHETPRPTQACSGVRTTACNPHARVEAAWTQPKAQKKNKHNAMHMAHSV